MIIFFVGCFKVLVGERGNMGGITAAVAAIWSARVERAVKGYAAKLVG